MYPEIVCLTNNIDTGLMQCEGCLSQKEEPGNQLVFCTLCLCAVHVKCHARTLAYTYSEDMTDFTCERCKFLIDNQPDKKDIKDIFRCKFCPEIAGLMIYVDKQKGLTNADDQQESDQAIFQIGWCHLRCLIWDNLYQFADDLRFEIKANGSWKYFRNK